MNYEIAKLGVSGFINDLVIKESMSFVDDESAREWALSVNRHQNESNLQHCNYVVISVKREDADRNDYVYL